MISRNWSRACFAACLLAVAYPAAASADAAFAKSVPVLDVRDPALLASLETRGFGLEAILGGGAGPSLRELHAASRAYRTLADQVGADVVGLRREMKQNGRILHEVTDQNVGRILDLRWLQSPLASFRLVGVVNRLDRKDFPDSVGEVSCGEVRFIYRLGWWQGVRRVRGEQQFRQVLQRERRAGKPTDLRGGPVLPRGFHVPGLARRDPGRRRRRQGPRLLLADLFPVPDADGQPS
jgi:hypothetical protein